MASANRPLVKVIGTGGSISYIGDSRLDYVDYSYANKHFTIDELLARVPEVSEFARIESEQFANVGSTDLGPEHWLPLGRRINQIFREEPEVAGIAITHGTATLEETAYYLNLVVKSDKPVVVTGAMRPPTAMSTDTDINILNCVQVAASPEARNMGVLSVLNNEIQAAREVNKTSTLRLETFNAHDLGCLGYADSNHQVVFYRAPVRKHTHQAEFDVDGLGQLPRVDIIYSYAGADDLLVNAAASSEARGMVVAGLGSGGSPAPFTRGMLKALEQGKVVMVASQAATGRVIANRRFREQGFVVSDNLSPRKARILLMLALTVTDDPQRIQHMAYEY